MTKRTKIIIGITAGVLLIGGISYAIYNNRRKKKLLEELDMEMEAGGYEVDESTGEVVKSGRGTSSSPDRKVSFPMGYISFRENGEHPVHLLKRPTQGTIVAGDEVTISGTSFDGDYPVRSVWVDAKGNVGALYLKIPYRPTGATDKTFENKGVITLN